MLLVSNSSFALEILTHEAHQHTGPAVTADLHVDLEMNMLNHDSMDASLIPESSLDDHVSHGDDDCICDEICCLSSVDFGMQVLTDTSSPGDIGKPVDLSLYISISLDLLLPPPTS
ncbi:MAG: hypothetical protein OXU66_06210 [Gammaproteobacteria bacterium]|nr:hypothetical protein [Gammaproteobacteria bacterium]